MACASLSIPTACTKRPRSKISSSSTENTPSPPNIDLLLHNTDFPVELEALLASAVFGIGLRQSSPKMLINLMEAFPDLSTEHIKSHLQKYRIHHDRSKEEFLNYYNNNIMELFDSWNAEQSWPIEEEESADGDSNSVSSEQDDLNGASATNINNSQPASCLPFAADSQIALGLLASEEALSHCLQAARESLEKCEQFLGSFQKAVASGL